MKNADMPIKHDPLPARDLDVYNPTTSGLTKREHFAAMAMQGILPISDLMDLDVVAKRAVRMADELLKELEK